MDHNHRLPADPEHEQRVAEAREAGRLAAAKTVAFIERNVARSAYSIAAVDHHRRHFGDTQVLLEGPSEASIVAARHWLITGGRLSIIARN